MGQHKFNPVAKAAKGGELPQKATKKIRTWEELDGLLSEDGRYKIEVELENGCGYIVPTFEVPDSEYWKHHEYLSTHTFYGKTYKYSNETLKKFGFNVELESWD